jgi:hypothetical protein
MEEVQDLYRTGRILQAARTLREVQGGAREDVGSGGGGVTRDIDSGGGAANATSEGEVDGGPSASSSDPPPHVTATVVLREEAAVNAALTLLEDRLNWRCARDKVSLVSGSGYDAGACVLLA